MRIRKPNWSRVVARLERGVAAGDLTAIIELGLTLADGIQDRNGRSLVRKNATYAVSLFRRAAAMGDATAAGSLGYAYDIGRGIRRNTTLALMWYRRAARLGDISAGANIATVYRDQGNFRLAHRWSLRAAKMGDGDAAVTAGYGYLYGIGARRNLRSARRMFRLALGGSNTTAYGREEALYNLAMVDIDSGNPRRAIPLLEQANGDGDYPEAASALIQIKNSTELTPCRCRRHLHKYLRGHAKCLQHPR